MPGRTLLQLRNKIARLGGRRFFSGTSTSVGAGSLTDTSTDGLQRWPNDRWNNLWLVDVNGVVFRTTDFVQSTGVLTLLPSGETPTTGAYTIMSMHPDEVLNAVNDAGNYLYNTLGIGRWLIDDSMVTNSPLYNSNFNEWDSSSAASGWAVTTSTLAREARGINTLNAPFVAKLTTAIGYVAPAASHLNDLLVLRGNTIQVYAVIKTDETGGATVTCNDGATTTTGTASTTVNGWQTISVEAVIGDSALKVEPRVNLASNSATVYVAQVWIEGGPLLRTMRASSVFLDGPSVVSLRAISDRNQPWELGQRRSYGGLRYTLNADLALTTGYAEYEFIPPVSGTHRLRLEGRVPVSTLAADTDVIEMSETEAQIVEHEAAIRVLERSIADKPLSMQADYRQRQSKLLFDKAKLEENLRRSTTAMLQPDIVGGRGGSLTVGG